MKNASIVLSEQMLNRIRGEYLEMPGLRLKREQAQRLWGLDESTCAQLLECLVDIKFLYRTVDGKYARLTEGAVLSLPLRPAKADVDSRAGTQAGKRPSAA